MRFLKTSEAATLLNVSANTLRAWERRFGFPKPQRSPGKHRLYTYGEVASLRDALQDGLSISSAISRAQEGLSSDTHTLVSALAGFDGERADLAMEAALALRTLERAVEEVLLPSLEELLGRGGQESAPWAFAARWGSAWLSRAVRLSSPPSRPYAVAIGDATRDELDPDHAPLRALELFLQRAGASVLALSARGVQGVGEALASVRPQAVVIAGDHLRDDAVARWAYNVRLAAGALPVGLYRRGDQTPRIRTTGAHVLPGGAADAQRRLFELIDEARAEPMVASPVAPVAPARRRVVAAGAGR